MHHKIKRALEEIDTAIYNGDTFDDPDDRKELVEYVERWCHKLDLPDEFAVQTPPAHTLDALKERLGLKRRR